MRDVLVCLDASTGKERWRVDFAERFKSPLPTFGFVSSPLVDGDHVYVQAGASFVKLNKQTGETVWRSLQDAGGMNGSAFSSPVKATLAGQPLFLVQTRERLAGVDEATGKELWSQKIEAFRGMNILTPVVFGDAIFTSTYGGKSWLFDLTRSGDATAPEKKLSVTERWQNKTQGYMSTPVVIDGHAYCHLKNQRFTCVDLAIGKESWTTTPFGKYWSLVAQGSKILALDERGDLWRFLPVSYIPANVPTVVTPLQWRTSILLHRQQRFLACDDWDITNFQARRRGDDQGGFDLGECWLSVSPFANQLLHQRLELLGEQAVIVMRSIVTPQRFRISFRLPRSRVARFQAARGKTTLAQPLRIPRRLFPPQSQSRRSSDRVVGRRPSRVWLPDEFWKSLRGNDRSQDQSTCGRIGESQRTT